MKKAGFPKKPSLKKKKMSNANISRIYRSLKLPAIALLVKSQKVSEFPFRILTGKLDDLQPRCGRDNGRTTDCKHVKFVTSGYSTRWDDYLWMPAPDISLAGSVIHE